jgi:hypothetical protein
MKFTPSRSSLRLNLSYARARPCRGVDWEIPEPTEGIVWAFYETCDSTYNQTGFRLFLRTDR